ncbi:MAG: hypothetical protein ACXVAN_01715, partial [Polyangia bacterium]
SCNNASCGQGTVQKQQANGELKCVPVDQQEAGIACDLDGGNVVIVGGKCVSAIQCDPGTTMNVNGICVGTGGGAPTCGTPATGKACVFGDIYDFTTNKKNATPVHVELYDAVGLLTGGGLIAMTDSSDGSSYIFKDFVPPAFGTIVVMTGRTMATMTMAGTGAQNVTPNNQYRVDAYALKQVDSAAWGFDITAGGAQVAKYYKDAKPAPNQLINNESMPAMGVTMIKDGAPAAGAKYFNDTLTAVDNALTATGASGTALVASPIPMGGMFPTFSGSGGGVSPWETLNGGSAPGVVIITRFHPGP